MSEQIETMVNEIAEMSLANVMELVRAIEDRFGVSAQAMVAAAPAAAGDAAAADEKSEFDVTMTSFGSNKIAVIKVVRAITGLGLKEAKELVEATPSKIKEAASKDDAASIKAQLEEAGAEVTVE